MTLEEELKDTLRLAAPLVVGQIAAVGMAATDVLFAGHLDARALTAIAVSLNFDITVLLMAMGVFMASAALVAQRRGSGVGPAELGPYLRGSLRLAVWLGLACNLLIYLLARPVVGLLLDDPVAIELAVEYLQVYGFGSVSICLWYALRFAAEGSEGARPVLEAGLLGLVVNLLVNSLLVFGFGPIPALGVTGIALATVIAYTVMPLYLAWRFRHHPSLQGLGLYAGSGTERGAGGLLMRTGFPVGLMLVAEAGLFVALSVLMARLGVTAIAAHQIALNVATIFFMVPVGIGLASSVRVGYAAGAGDRLAARRAGLVGMGLGAGLSVLGALLMMNFALPIVALYTSDAAILSLAASLLWVGGLFQVADAVQTTANSALRGVSDTHLPMLFTLAGFWAVGLPAAWLFGFERQMGALGIWWGMTAGIVAVAVLLWTRFMACTSEPSEVIESAVIV